MLEYTLSRFLIIFLLMVAHWSQHSPSRDPLTALRFSRTPDPAVVNISTSQKVQQRRSRGPGQPPFDRFFEEFFDQRRGGQAPSQKVSSWAVVSSWIQKVLSSLIIM